MDYIRDVYAEMFDINYDFHIEDENKNEFILHFNLKSSLNQVQEVSEKINEHHLQTGEIFETL